VRPSRRPSRLPVPVAPMGRTEPGSSAGPRLGHRRKVMPLDRIPKEPVSRRGGLPAVAAAMLLVLGLGARPAAANDLSTSPCTASDVEIVGTGLIVNEPCICPPGGTFSATVQFTIRNNTNSGRYCVPLHLVPAGLARP